MLRLCVQDRGAPRDREVLRTEAKSSLTRMGAVNVLVAFATAHLATAGTGKAGMQELGRRFADKLGDRAFHCSRLQRILFNQHGLP